MATLEVLLKPGQFEADQALRDWNVVYQWLNDQAERLGFHITLSTEAAHMQGGYLYLPIHIREARDPYDFAAKSQTLEDTWNDQEPRPDTPIYLVPEKSPEQNAVWQRLWETRGQKVEAANAVAEAATENEQQSALAKLRTARQEEIQAEEEYNRFYQLEAYQKN